MSPETEPVVTMRTIYESLEDVKRSLSAMGGHGKDLDDHEARLRSLERWVWGAAGAGTVGGAALSQVVTALLN
jgi:hypothetical protein